MYIIKPVYRGVNAPIRANIILDSGFDTAIGAGNWITNGIGWTSGAGVAHQDGSDSFKYIVQNRPGYRNRRILANFRCLNWVSGQFYLLAGGLAISTTLSSGNGLYSFLVTSGGASDGFGILCASGLVADFDDFKIFPVG